MIARKIVYQGSFQQDVIALIFDITRKIEITGEVRAIGSTQIELVLEGDPSMIKLLQHQIERRAKSSIKDKQITQIPYKNYSGITFLN
jgi:hypothetical protein